MIKRTLYFGNSAYLHLDNKQLIVKLPQVEKNQDMHENIKKTLAASIPIEDIGVVILDDKQVTITQALISSLLDNNVALISCSENHMPAGLFLPLERRRPMATLGHQASARLFRPFRGFG